MKRGFALLLVLGFIVLSAACAEQNAATGAVSQNAPTDAVSQEEDGIDAGGIEENGDPKDTGEVEEGMINLKIGEFSFTATLAENSSAQALKEMLAEGPVTVDMRDYENMEKVGSLDTSLPRNDESITTQPGDLILYQGNALVIYYEPNTWNFTRLGKINDVTQEELKEALGTGDVSVTLSLERD
jgi:hypothetical protein